MLKEKVRTVEIHLPICLPVKHQQKIRLNVDLLEKSYSCIL